MGTAKRPQIGVGSWAKRAVGLDTFAWMTVTFGIAASRFADGLAALRVTAKISKDGLFEMDDLEFRAEMRAPPCFPVAPVIRRRRVMVVLG